MCCVCLLYVLLLLYGYPVHADADHLLAVQLQPCGTHFHKRHRPCILLLTMHNSGKTRLCIMCAACLQMYLQVREFIPNVQYNSRAQVLSLKTPGKRKQERLPGTAESWPPEPGCLLGVKGSLLACLTAHEDCSLPLSTQEEACSASSAPDGDVIVQPCWVTVQTRALRAATPCAGTVAVLSAGTADEGVAEECRAVADYMGCYSFRQAWLQPCMLLGVPAGLHNVVLRKGVMYS